MHEGEFIKCDQCDKQFTFTRGVTYLARHISNEHEGFRLKCSLCDYTCRQRRSLEGHISTVREKEPKVECNLCGKLFLGERSLKGHIYTIHTRKAISCIECPKNLSSMGSLKMHFKSFHQIIKCNMCDFRSKDQPQAEKHNQEKHNGVKYTCNQCDYESQIFKDLDEHQNENKHEGMKFQCHLCKYRATLQGNLKVHVQAMHEGLTYKCDVCNFSASTPRTVGWHKKAKHVQISQFQIQPA